MRSAEGELVPSPRLRASRTASLSASALLAALASSPAFAQPVRPPTREELEGTLRPQPRDARPRLDVEG